MFRQYSIDMSGIPVNFYTTHLHILLLRKWIFAYMFPHICCYKCLEFHVQRSESVMTKFTTQSICISETLIRERRDLGQVYVLLWLNQSNRHYKIQTRILLIHDVPAYFSLPMYTRSCSEATVHRNELSRDAYSKCDSAFPTTACHKDQPAYSERAEWSHRLTKKYFVKISTNLVFAFEFWSSAPGNSSSCEHPVFHLGALETLHQPCTGHLDFWSNVNSLLAFSKISSAESASI